MVKFARRRRSVPDESSQVSPVVTDPPEPVPEPVPEPTPDVSPASAEAPRPRRGGTARLLVRAAHPRWALALAVGLAVGAAVSGRAPREVLLVLVTVLVGQTILGWHNDLVDRDRDAAHQVAGKPLADGGLEPGTVWFAMTCAVLLLVPLSVTNGITAGSSYLLSVLVGVLGNVALRQGLLSWVTWAVSYALLPAFLSYGGFGGQAEGDPPRILVTALFALLGIGAHLVGSVWGLVPDDAAGWRTLPLRLGRRVGSARLLTISATYVAVVLVAIVLAGATDGLSR